MEMMNFSRTDLVTRSLLFTGSGNNCGVVKEETWIPDSLPPLMKDAIGMKETGDFTVAVYYTLVVTDPTSGTPPTDCDNEYSRYVTGPHTPLYTSEECKNLEKSAA
ncbi:uncharacterized protein LOC142587069 [Dermacentor variabilis]|uniref:uncharacterized protein LOC142587069 n=1 Tax=Dermacentor variabilis TaxID=34621 RepID=UPI003F5C8817